MRPACPDKQRWKWVEQFETMDRVLKKTMLPGNVEVSTVFLGVNHNFSERGPPLLWETIIFDGAHHHECERYASAKDALTGHADMVKLAKGKMS